MLLYGNVNNHELPVLISSSMWMWMLMLMLYIDSTPWEMGDRFVISVHFLCSMVGIQSWNWCNCPRGELQDPSLKNAMEKFLTVILNLSRLNVT